MPRFPSSWNHPFDRALKAYIDASAGGGGGGWSNDLSEHWCEADVQDGSWGTTIVAFNLDPDWSAGGTLDPDGKRFVPDEPGVYALSYYLDLAEPEQKTRVNVTVYMNLQACGWVEPGFGAHQKIKGAGVIRLPAETGIGMFVNMYHATDAVDSVAPQITDAYLSLYRLDA